MLTQVSQGDYRSLTAAARWPSKLFAMCVVASAQINNANRASPWSRTYVVDLPAVSNVYFTYFCIILRLQKQNRVMRPARSPRASQKPIKPLTTLISYLRASIRILRKCKFSLSLSLGRCCEPEWIIKSTIQSGTEPPPGLLLPSRKYTKLFLKRPPRKESE